MLALDSLVIDLVFQVDTTLEPEKLVDALGGPDVAAARQMLDPDMQDPRFEMQLSPSMPFRQRGERRLLIMDDSVAPMREDPQSEFHIKLDLREEKQRLIAMCETAPVRLGRLNALGSWGDAVIVARSARDLRAVCLIPWALDPAIAADGRKRASRLSQAEFEEKLATYDKRLDELSEEQILANIGPAKLTRQGDLLIVDVLEEDGTWDLRKSLAMESALAAIGRFSILPGAPSTEAPASAPEEQSSDEPAAADEARRSPPESVADPDTTGSHASSLQFAELGDRVVLVFPAERFDLDVAAAIGKGDYETVIGPGDALTGQTQDRIMRDGAGFIAPIEFFSEVFLDGSPLSRPQFDAGSTSVGDTRTMQVHYPRLGPVLLLDAPGLGRFVSSEQDAESVLRLVRETR